VLAQAREVVKHQRVRAIKIGALGSAANVRAVGDWLAARGVPVVVDTPMMPSRGGARLLAERALDAVRASLVPRATLLTVNVPEAEALLRRRVVNVGEAREAAQALVAMGARAALVKGGHLSGAQAIDVLAHGGRIVELRAKRLAIGGVHGTGCTFASLIAGRIAAGDDLMDAVRWAKKRHHAALARAVNVGGDLRVIAFD
jgi:hydroxymethylpyrimidine/phosphomethylpyrimidine kinase